MWELTSTLLGKGFEEVTQGLARLFQYKEIILGFGGTKL